MIYKLNIKSAAGKSPLMNIEKIAVDSASTKITTSNLIPSHRLAVAYVKVTLHERSLSRIKFLWKCGIYSYALILTSPLTTVANKE